MPLTTRPAVTSRQGMMRLASMGLGGILALQEVADDGETDGAGFFGMGAGAFLVVAGGELDGIAGVAELDEVDAFDDASGADVVADGGWAHWAGFFLVVAGGE